MNEKIKMLICLGLAMIGAICLADGEAIINGIVFLFGIGFGWYLKGAKEEDKKDDDC